MGTTPKSSIPAILSAHGGKPAATRSAIEIAPLAKPAAPPVVTPSLDVTATPVVAPAIEAATAVSEAIATAASEPAKVPAPKARAPRFAAPKPSAAAPAPKVAEQTPVQTAAAPPVESAETVAKPAVEAVEAAAEVATSVVEAAKPAPALAEPMVEAAKAAPEIAETVIEEAASATKTITDAAAAAFPAAAPAAPTASKDYWTMATVYETPKMTDMTDRAKSAFEKSGKMVEEFNEFAKGNVEALVESGKIAAKGFETLGQDAADYGRRSFETLTATMKSMASVKSPTEFFKLQSDYVRTAFDSAVAEASKSTEAMLKLAGDASQPLSNRMAVAAEKAKIAA